MKKDDSEIKDELRPEYDLGALRVRKLDLVAGALAIRFDSSQM
jgi:hypothetical protein